MAQSPAPRDQKILDKLDAGDLPRKGPKKISAGFGQGDQCAACDSVVAPGEVEYEVDFGGGLTYHMHRECAEIWEAECERRGFHRRSS